MALLDVDWDPFFLGVEFSVGPDAFLCARFEFAFANGNGVADERKKKQKNIIHFNNSVVSVFVYREKINNILPGIFIVVMEGVDEHDVSSNRLFLLSN